MGISAMTGARLRLKYGVDDLTRGTPGYRILHSGKISTRWTSVMAEMAQKESLFALNADQRGSVWI